MKVLFYNLRCLIQMFAVQTTLLNSLGNDLSPEMKTYYDMRLLDYAQAQLVHDQFGQKRPIPKNGGKTIEFRSFTPLAKALTPLTEGVTPSGNQLDVQTITATVAQYGDYICQSDVLELTALDNTILEATKLLGRQAGLTLDTITRNAIVAGTNVMYAPTWSGTPLAENAVTSRGALDKTAVLTVDLVEQVATELRAQNAPTINGDYVCILHPYVAYDLKRDPDWRKPHEYVDTDNIYAGEIGKIGGVRFVASTEAKIFRGDDLLSTARALTAAATTSSAITSLNVSETLVAHALKDRYININGVTAKVTDNTTSAISFASTDFGSITSGTTKIYPGEGGKAGISVFACLFFGDGAYGVTEVSGGGLQTIVKQKGSAGTADPLDQRSSVGWKALKTAEILLPSYLIRVECASKRYSDTAKAN